MSHASPTVRRAWSFGYLGTGVTLVSLRGCALTSGWSGFQAFDWDTQYSLSIRWKSWAMPGTPEKRGWKGCFSYGMLLISLEPWRRQRWCGAVFCETLFRQPRRCMEVLHKVQSWGFYSDSKAVVSRSLKSCGVLILKISNPVGF